MVREEEELGMEAWVRGLEKNLEGSLKRNGKRGRDMGCVLNVEAIGIGNMFGP